MASTATVTATASVELPHQLATKGYRHIKLGSSGERLKHPIELGWNVFNLDELEAYIKERQTKWDEDEASGRHEDLRANEKYVPRRPVFRNRLNNYAYDEPEFVDWLKRGNNYGVTSSGGLIKLESDDIERWQALGVLDLLPETFTVQSSSPNRQHFYYIGPEVADSPLKDPETNEDIGHIRGTGEAGGRGGMVVGPGSLHPLNVRYMVVKDLPVASISQEALDKVKAKFAGSEKLKTDGQETKTKTNKQLNQNKIQGNGNANPNKYSDPFLDLTCIDVLGPGWDWHYESDQMVGQNPYPGHDNTPGDPHHALTIKSNDREFFCFECQDGKLGGGGVSKLIAIRAGIMKCNDSRSSPDGKDWWDTVRYAFNEGLIDKETARAAGLSVDVDAEPELSPEEIEKRYKENPDCLEDTRVLAALRALSPIRRENFLNKLKLKQRQKKNVEALLFPLEPEETATESKNEEEAENPIIKAKALEILVHGNPIDFVLDTLEDFHAGDRKTGELLLCTTVQGNCLNAFGTQPKLSGGSGKGKTHLCKALRHLIPKEWILYTSLSPKALWYASDIKPGMIIFSDDVRIHEEMEDTLKKSMSNFQEPSVYRVLNKDHEVEVRALPERIVWWLTSVLDDQEEQLRNRFFSGGVDESAEQDLRALDLTFAPLAEGREEFPVTENVLICREIIRIIKVDKWIVWAPFLKDGEELAVNWGNPSERRNPGRFADLLASYAILRSGQREIIDCGNYKKVIATIEDFNSAKDLYETRAENLTTKLSDSDLHFIRWLKDKSIDNQPFQFTVNGIAGMYTGEDGKGLSPQTIERRLLGRKDRGSYGLLEKLKGGILTVEKKSISEGKLDRNKDTKKTQTTVFLQFTFNPDKFDSLGCYSSVVTLKNPQQARENPIKSQQIPKDGKDQKDHPSTPNPNKKDIKSHNREDREGFKSKGGDGGGIEDKTPNPSLSVKGGISGISGKTREPDTGMVLPMPGKNMGSDPSIIDLKADLQRAAEEARKKEAHAREQAAKYTGKPPLICAKCGEDLTGHGQITKGDKVYCAKVGCGYPKRGEGRAEA